MNRLSKALQTFDVPTFASIFGLPASTDLLLFLSVYRFLGCWQCTTILGVFVKNFRRAFCEIWPNNFLRLYQLRSLLLEIIILDIWISCSATYSKDIGRTLHSFVIFV